ncbi:uncharacterized protein LOC132066670 [Lycium ferocissimum]|uniref:uncharacterized protein LOC132066670 n=1 Tax=Lycium ferocissimum TaxID=112874 RepID=UPI002814D5E8|nr:uncharacterized protein LOC132066670 [Lycium ferocissimum]
MIFPFNFRSCLTIRVEYYFSLSMKEVKFHSGNHQSNIQPLCIKHINLAILFSSVSRYESLLDELFSYFHPRTVLVRMNSDALKHNFIQVLLNELKGRDKECTKRYKYINYMSWRYFLKGYEILESTTITRKGAHQISLEFQWFK